MIYNFRKLYEENRGLSPLDEQTKEEAKLYSLKLKNMRLHLQELLAKKLRLELEIKSLKKILIKRQREYEKSLKLKVSLESHQSFTQEEKEELFRTRSALAESLQDFDRTSAELLQFIQEISTENEEFSI